MHHDLLFQSQEQASESIDLLTKQHTDKRRQRERDRDSERQKKGSSASLCHKSRPHYLFGRAGAAIVIIAIMKGNTYS